MILGTAAYMAPEQARGKTVDRRADIWAFGAVLFEMLTGARRSRGDDVTDTLAARAAREPDWNALPAAATAARRHDAQALSAEGRQAARARHRRRAPGAGGRVRDGRAADDGRPATAAAPRGRLAWMAALASRCSWRPRSPCPPCGICAKRRRLRHPKRGSRLRTPATTDAMSFALSPDGRQIVFVASGDGASRLWVRPLDTTAAQPLAGTEGATLSVLVARQPVHWLLCRERVEAARPRQRRPADTGTRIQRARRHVERGGRDCVCAGGGRPGHQAAAINVCGRRRGPVTAAGYSG